MLGAGTVGLGTLFGLDQLCVQVESKVGSTVNKGRDELKGRMDDVAEKLGQAGRLAGPGHGNRACSRTSLEK